ncbi:hypothetical protein K7432_009614 [Basidiobolus ranarum]|uniref:Uncharacterized protein n=1 Tax=Basidiobolus ranarum TaxID=34480 RepID=A0ABR2WQ05_9FUNG
MFFKISLICTTLLASIITAHQVGSTGGTIRTLISTFPFSEQVLIETNGGILIPNIVLNDLVDLTPTEFQLLRLNLGKLIPRSSKKLLSKLGNLLGFVSKRRKFLLK